VGEVADDLAVLLVAVGAQAFIALLAVLESQRFGIEAEPGGINDFLESGHAVLRSTLYG
jgi:hypothetical protein